VKEIHKSPRWRSFIALGDSFTEGLSDALDVNGRHIGWADRTAQGIANSQSTPISYANLAVRGKLIGQVAREQIPEAIALAPDLVSFAAGVNDTLRRNFELNAVASALEESVKKLRQANIDVMLFAFGNPSRRSGLMSLVADRMASYRSATLAIANEYDCFVVDFWNVAAFDDDSEWDADRLHLSPSGHRRASEAALHTLGLADDSWRTPGTQTPLQSVPARIFSNASWLSAHLTPWLARRVKGTSSGDGIEPKLPKYTLINPV
jgi:lysophospholipase L1-like esterase